MFGECIDLLLKRSDTFELHVFLVAHLKQEGFDSERRLVTGCTTAATIGGTFRFGMRRIVLVHGRRTVLCFEHRAAVPTASSNPSQSNAAVTVSHLCGSALETGFERSEFLPVASNGGSGDGQQRSHVRLSQQVTLDLQDEPPTLGAEMRIHALRLPGVRSCAMS